MQTHYSAGRKMWSPVPLRKTHNNREYKLDLVSHPGKVCWEVVTLPVPSSDKIAESLLQSLQAAPTAPHSPDPWFDLGQDDYPNMWEYPYYSKHAEAVEEYNHKHYGPQPLAPEDSSPQPLAPEDSSLPDVWGFSTLCTSPDNPSSNDDVTIMTSPPIPYDGPPGTWHAVEHHNMIMWVKQEEDVALPFHIPTPDPVPSL